MSATHAVRRVTYTAVALLTLVAAFVVTGGVDAEANHQPANKVAASGSTIETVGGETVLLSEQIKINNPTDLILQFSSECAIITQVTSSANGETDRAFGEVVVWIEIDGQPVPVSTTDMDESQDGVQTDDGEIVLCNREQEQQWTDSSDPLLGGDDGGDQLRQYLKTTAANGFNWLALNVGDAYDADDDNIVKVEVLARYTKDGQTAGELADAYVGRRTLILDPVKSANDEQVTTLSS